MNNPNYKNINQLKEELSNISPLALPQYLADCEFYDLKNAQLVLDKAIAEFENKGGIAGSLTDSILTGSINGIALILLKSFDKTKKTYDKMKRGKINIGNILKEVKEFKYPQEYIFLNSYRDSIMQDRLQRADSGIPKEYDNDIRKKVWDNENRKKDFKEKNFKEKDVLGINVYKNQKSSLAATGGVNHNAEVDHIIPIKVIYDQHSNFSQRYLGKETTNSIVNSDDNYQMMNKSSNISKGDSKQEDWVKRSENRILIEEEQLKSGKIKDIEKHKKRLDRRKQELKNKKKLIDDSKNAQKTISEKMLKSGTTTVLMEQIGKIIETMVGPISFEIRDSIRNGLNHGFNSDEQSQSLILRIWRVLKYIAKQLPKLIGNLIGDLTAMVAQFFAELTKVIRDFFGKFLDIALSGISILIEAIKILVNPNTSKIHKGDAICKLMITFVTNIAGAFIIDFGLNYLGIPDPWSEIIAVLSSSVLSAIVIHFFDKLDVFNIKRELRKQRIKEIFDLRIQSLKEDTQNFDIAAVEKLKAQRVEFEEVKNGISSSLKLGDFEELNENLKRIVNFFQVNLPYSTTAEFIAYLKKDEVLIS